MPSDKIFLCKGSFITPVEDRKYYKKELRSRLSFGGANSTAAGSGGSDFNIFSHPPPKKGSDHFKPAIKTKRRKGLNPISPLLVPAIEFYNFMGVPELPKGHKYSSASLAIVLVADYIDFCYLLIYPSEKEKTMKCMHCQGHMKEVLEGLILKHEAKRWATTS